MKNRLLRKFGFGGVALAAVIWASPVAAMPLYDFSDALGGGTEGFLPGMATSFTVGPVTVTGWSWDGAAWVQSPLWVRDVEPNDNGFGVCSEGGAACNSGGGDVNELSQLTNAEAITLSLAPGFSWDSLWLSSLDDNGSGANNENGNLYWGTGADPAAIFGGATGSQGFASGGLNGCVGCGSAEGFLPSSGWLNTSFDLLFVPGAYGATGANEDYLVWGVSASQPTIPEPMTLSLFGLGLVGLAARLRRRHSA